jgi:hypothetical protein
MVDGGGRLIPNLPLEDSLVTAKLKEGLGWQWNTVTALTPKHRYVDGPDHDR